MSSRVTLHFAHQLSNRIEFQSLHMSSSNLNRFGSLHAHSKRHPTLWFLRRGAKVDMNSDTCLWSAATETFASACSHDPPQPRCDSSAMRRSDCLGSVRRFRNPLHKYRSRGQRSGLLSFLPQRPTAPLS
ncbi:uncharacterized protein UDID_18421 [Ustilago sp. UG-2017a]|nr:uncharacterized protein UDID_18421 [Ustilago sp. UG-2017a]